MYVFTLLQLMKFNQTLYICLHNIIIYCCVQMFYVPKFSLELNTTWNHSISRLILQANAAG